MRGIDKYTAPDQLLVDRVILISGVTEGIGRALAAKCAALGATIVLLGRNVSRLKSLHDEITEAGGPRPGIFPFNLETTEWAEYEKITEVLGDEYGRLDGLVHCGGILGELSPIEHHDPYLWYRVLQVNLNAPFLLTRAGMTLLRKSADPSVIFVSSTVRSGARGGLTGALIRFQNLPLKGWPRFWPTKPRIFQSGSIRSTPVRPAQD